MFVGCPSNCLIKYKVYTVHTARLSIPHQVVHTARLSIPHQVVHTARLSIPHQVVHTARLSIPHQVVHTARLSIPHQVVHNGRLTKCRSVRNMEYLLCVGRPAFKGFVAASFEGSSSVKVWDRTMLIISPFGHYTVSM